MFYSTCQFLDKSYKSTLFSNNSLIFTVPLATIRDQTDDPAKFDEPTVRQFFMSLMSVSCHQKSSSNGMSRNKLTNKIVFMSCV